jgi:VanZ family protein
LVTASNRYTEWKPSRFGHLVLTKARSNSTRLILAWLPAIFWIGVIMLESTPYLGADHTGSWLAAIVSPIFGHSALKYVDFINHIMRKTGHFTGYGILSFLLYRGWREITLIQLEDRLKPAMRTPEFLKALRRIWCARASALAILSTFLVASLDEFHQSFLPNRTGVFRDVLLDTTGALFFQAVILTLSALPPGHSGTSEPRQAKEVGAGNSLPVSSES